jgi:hypothetical protein
MMKSSLWVLTLVLAVGTVAIVWYVRDADLQRLERQRMEQETIRDALIDAALMDTIQVADMDSIRWIIARKPGETDAQFVARAGRLLEGESLVGPCWESFCPGVGQVKICVACGPTEPETECQARLDALVAAWCEEHPDCDNCP